jgi:anti-sigma B factor antagonist
MELSATRVGDMSVVTPTGELDVSTADELRECLFGEVADGARRVVLDLSAVTFLDSTTLGVLVGTRKRLERNGGRLDLVCQHPMVLKVLRTTAFDRVFAIHASVAEILAQH